MSREPREPHEPRQPIPQPPPTPTPQPTRLGNPSASNQIEFIFGEPPPATISGYVPEPFPPIPGGEDTTLELSSDRASYVWGNTAHIMAHLKFKSDNAGLGHRPIGFNIDGETFVVKTDMGGFATVYWKPFGVPAPGQPAKVFRAYAFFLGY